MPVTCPACGADAAEGARFCSVCGAAFAHACPSCGADVPTDARFCPACGTPVEAAGTAGPGEERKTVTILFADVTGSTTLGEQLDPEQLRDVLATYFAAMREEIEAEGGTVEKFIGDAVMAAFGVPVAHEDDPARALRAARRMLARLEEVNRTLAATHGVELAIRIGVNTGEVLAATTPAPGEPMVTGDVVNTASRLQSAADVGGVLVAERTTRAVRGFRFGTATRLELKGKTSAFTARSLLGAEDAPERGIPGLSAPMVGREEELDLLRSLYQRVATEDRPHLVTVYGEPGVGKSRLTQEFLAWAATNEPSPRVLRGRCLPYGDGITYWPLAEILMAHTGIGVGDPPDVILRKVRDTCARDLDGLGELDASAACAALAYTLGVQDPEHPMADREPRQIRAEMHASWRGLLARIAAERPLVVVVEDIHWADPALLDLLEEVSDRAEGALLLICPARPSLLDRRSGWGGGRRDASSLGLEPLSVDESDRLISLLLAIDDLPASTHTSIRQRAEGNPFFLEEIVRQLIDEGLIAFEDGRWHAVDRIADVEIPDTVQAVLAARIDLLEPAGKRTLQLASVVGRVFWPGPVERLLNGERASLAETLDHLEARDLVRSRVGSSIAGEAEYAFKHVLTRDVAYEALPRRDRARAHESVAGWIESVTTANEYGELLAYHYEEAYRAEREDPHGDDARREALRGKALEWAVRAAWEAVSRFTMSKALSLAERALGLADTPFERVTALELRGRAAQMDYRGDLAWESFRQAADLRAERLPEDRTALAITCASALEPPMRWPGSMRQPPAESEIRRYLDLGLRAAGDERSEALARLLTAKAFVPFSYGFVREVPRDEIDEAVIAGLGAADIAEELGRPVLVSAALDAATAAFINLGDYAAAAPITERRLRLVDVIDDAFEIGDIHAMASWTRLFLGDLEGSVDAATEGATHGRDSGAAGVEIHAISWRAFAEFERGRWDVVIDELIPRAEVVLGDRAASPPYFLQHLFGSAATIATIRDDAVLAARLGEVVEELLAGGRRTRAAGSGSIAAWHARCLLIRGRDREATEALEAAEAGFSRAAWPLYLAVLADAYAQTERWDEVAGFLERTRAYATDAGITPLHPRLDRLEGRAAIAAGDVNRGLAFLTRVRDRFTALGMPWEQARTELPLAETLATAGRAEEATAVLRSAIPVLEGLRAVQELGRAQALAGRLGAAEPDPQG